MIEICSNRVCVVISRTLRRSAVCDCGPPRILHLEDVMAADSERHSAIRR